MFCDQIPSNSKSIKGDDIFCFTLSDKEAKPKQTLPVKLTFTSILGKNCFLDSLGKLKNTDFGGMSVVIDVPKFLISAYFELDSFGYNFRNEITGES